MKYELTVKGQFSAAHALRHYQGKCEKTHGHNFEVAVCVAGTELDSKTGMLLDFGVLKKGLACILEDMDHRFLNETPPFDSLNPSSENMARFIGTKMQAFLAECPDPQAAKVGLVRVAVSEKHSQIAVWLP